VKSALKRIATRTSKGSSASWNPPGQALFMCTGQAVPVSYRWITL
jgi:hypothetical protein